MPTSTSSQEPDLPQPSEQSDGASTNGSSSKKDPRKSMDLQILNVCETGDIEACKKYLEAFQHDHPRLECLDSNSSLPWMMLLLAIALSERSTVASLLSTALANDHSLTSPTIMEITMSNHDLTILKMLHDHDPELFQHEYYEGLQTPLGLACSRCKDSSVLLYMLDYELEICPRGFSNPLLDAIGNGHPLTVIKRLVEKGAPVQNAALEKALERSCIDILECLLGKHNLLPSQTVIEKAYKTEDQAIINALQRKSLMWRTYMLAWKCSMFCPFAMNLPQWSSADKHAT